MATQGIRGGMFLLNSMTESRNIGPALRHYIKWGDTMTLKKMKTPAGAAVSITDSGWKGCTEAELERRRCEFLRTAAEVFVKRQPGGTAETAR